MRAPICTACPIPPSCVGCSIVKSPKRPRLAWLLIWTRVNRGPNRWNSWRAAGPASRWRSNTSTAILRRILPHFGRRMRKLDVNVVLPQAAENTRTRTTPAVKDSQTVEDIPLDFPRSARTTQYLGKLGRFDVVGVVVCSGGMGVCSFKPGCLSAVVRWR